MDHTDKVVGMLYDCRKEVGLTILPPHVNLSSYEFAVVDDKTIRYGLGAIKGVGEGAVDAIVGERKAQWRLREPRRSVPPARSVARSTGACSKR